jgi:hypothetical protein
VFPNKSIDLIYADASALFNQNKLAAYSDKPVATDYDGFQRLLTNIQEKNGKMIYLTARNSNTLNITKKQFEEIGLIYDEENTYYTNNTIQKGEFLEEVLEIDKKTPIIFIDDLDENLNNVFDKYPNSKCYKFIYEPKQTK